MRFLTERLLLSLLLLFPLINTHANGGINIIPKPQKVEIKEGQFELNRTTQIVKKGITYDVSTEVFKKDINKSYGLSLIESGINDARKSKQSIKNSILLQHDADLGFEAYRIDVKENEILCSASSSEGFFYALQSLIHMISTDAKNRLTIPCVEIDDKPLLSWRGYMLDDSRHFFGKEAVKQYLDIMARLKLNRFHWHLTDEPAWRIEIKRYPLLTSIGAIGSWDDKDAPHAFYSQQDVKEIVAYAAERHIMVIPEIDMPGHATAAARSYPEISGGGEGRWKDFTFHPAKEETYEFIDNIMTEIADLFPAPYIHIGADEVHYGNQSWFTDKTMQDFIKANNLKNEVGLEHYFVRRACDIVNSKGKKMIGWDEITSVGLDPSKAVVMWWRHDKPEALTRSLNDGFDVILTPRIPCYFDFVQDQSHKIGRRWGNKFNELTTVYDFPESISSLIVNNKSQILGLQANLWTERVAGKERLDFMTFPRLLAIAEDGWTDAEKKDYEDFEKRVAVFLIYLKSEGINYFDIFDKSTTPEPWGPSKADVISEG